MESGIESGVVDGCHRLDPAIKVARHPVRRAKIELLVPVIREVEQPRVFEKPADDADDPDALADACHPRSQTADPAHDQIDFNSGLRCRVERLDHLRVYECVHLRDYPRRLSFASICRFALDHLQEAEAHVGGSNQ